MDPAQLNRNDWTIRESTRAKNLRVQIFPHDGVEIVVLRRTSQRALKAFIAEHHDWILANQAAYRARRGDEPELPVSIDLKAVGESFTLRYLRGTRVRVRENGDELHVFTPDESRGTVWPALQNWLKQKARPHLSACLTACTAETGLQPSRLQVRLQKTRWGSCSPNGTISLNAAVMLRSPEEMRYVVIHELCHLRHMNHGKRYWQLVGRFEPDYRAIDRSLARAWDDTPLWLT